MSAFKRVDENGCAKSERILESDAESELPLLWRDARNLGARNVHQRRPIRCCGSAAPGDLRADLSHSPLLVGPRLPGRFAGLDQRDNILDRPQFVCDPCGHCRREFVRLVDLGAFPRGSSISPVAILATMTAAPITSAGRFSPRGLIPRWLRWHLTQ
jgi:hypothetical protein